jgi:formate/nitrite transporter FocA (FNT family)
VAGEGVFLWFYHPPGREPLGTIALLFVTAVLALLLGTLALAAGPRVGLGAIRRKMAFSVGLGALVAVGDVLLTARLMLVRVPLGSADLTYY